MVDLDAPSRQNPTSREWLHWLVVNIPGGNISQGEERKVYKGPNPPKDMGKYLFLNSVY